MGECVPPLASFRSPHQSAGPEMSAQQQLEGAAREVGALGAGGRGGGEGGAAPHSRPGCPGVGQPPPATRRAPAAAPAAFQEAGARPHEGPPAVHLHVTAGAPRCVAHCGAVASSFRSTPSSSWLRGQPCFLRISLSRGRRHQIFSRIVPPCNLKSIHMDFLEQIKLRLATLCWVG